MPGSSQHCTTTLWFVVYSARSEQFERLRGRAERDHAAVGAAGSTSNYDSAKPWRTRSGGMRTCTGPPSSTLLAPSRRLQLLKMVLHNLLWRPELPRGQGPGIAQAAHASIHGRRRFPLHQSIPTKEEISSTSSKPRHFAREAHPSALTSRIWWQ